MQRATRVASPRRESTTTIPSNMGSNVACIPTPPSGRSALQEANGGGPACSHVSLHEREVGAHEHRLGLAQRLDLACPCLLPSVVVFHQPIALPVERFDVLERGCQLLACGRLGIRMCLQL